MGAALILQYAMYDRVAQKTLTADPSLGLAHLYRPGTFIQEPHPPGKGVWVTGAGIAEANGWYRRRENSEGPPRATHWHPKDFKFQSRGSQWYEKDDGCFIYWHGSYCWWRGGRCFTMPCWLLCSKRKRHRYRAICK